MITNTATVTTLSHNDAFRMGVRPYRVWTLAGFYAEAQTRDAANAHRWAPEAWMSSFDAYKAEQNKRGSADRGASPEATVLVGDRREAARRAEEFRARIELAWGDVVEIDGVQYTLTRGNNDHGKFVPVQ